MTETWTTEDLHNGLFAAAGRIAALEYALQLLIVTHPQKSFIKQLWDGLLPEQIDKWSKDETYASNEDLRHGLHQELNHLREFFDVDMEKSDPT